MTVYRLAESVRLVEGAPPGLNQVRYFVNRDRALSEARRAARVFAAMYDCEMVETVLDRYDVVAVWQNRFPDPDYEVHLSQGDVEDADE